MITPPEITTTVLQRTAAVHMVISRKDVGSFMDPAIREVMALLEKQDRHPVGPMFSYHLRRPSDTFDFELGFPIAEPIQATGRVVNSRLPAAKVLRCIHTGPYEDLATAWGELRAHAEAQVLKEEGRFWECYLTDLRTVKDPAAYRTQLNYVIG